MDRSTRKTLVAWLGQQKWLSDTSLKLVFDHFRNLGIAASVCGVGVLLIVKSDSLRLPAPLELGAVSAAALVFTLGVVLYFFNILHGLKLLLESCAKRPTKGRIAIAILGYALYSIAVSVLLLAVVVRSLFE